ncbi:MAG: hypothetical protein GWO24_29945, partial [Akkermansiaceae bacterium]|nr:hypothetical protein [Akkermansiaceae bacterium]
GQSLVDPANAQRYWAKVQEYAPEATGFSPAIDRKYGSGIAIIDLEGKWTPTSARNVERAGRLAGEELGLQIEALR